MNQQEFLNYYYNSDNDHTSGLNEKDFDYFKDHNDELFINSNFLNEKKISIDFYSFYYYQGYY